MQNSCRFCLQGFINELGLQFECLELEISNDDQHTSPSTEMLLVMRKTNLGLVPIELMRNTNVSVNLLGLHVS